ncbi:MAG: hypothetical protein BGN86_13350 [Caulobacterales bacterium 68-7]|nr:MAG: hypothetical protein BGN86_13350 [Caulobacterales bacterium 68-7]
MKYPIAFSLVTSVLLAACAATPSHRAQRMSNYGPVSTDPRTLPRKPPVQVALGGIDRSRDVEPYRPAIVLLPKDTGPKDYQEYVKRELRRDPDDPYRGVRRNKPWGW